MEQTLDRRTALLEAIVDFLLANGVADLSLRPLAEGVGTSARLLIYHFDSKENLLACALAEVRRRIARALRTLSEGEPDTSLEGALLRFWAWATAAPNQNYFRLLFELDGLAMYGRIRFSDEARSDSGAVWLSLIDSAARVSGETDTGPAGRAMLIRAAFTGLLQDFLSTGEHERTTEALHYLIGRMEEG